MKTPRPAVNPTLAPARIRRRAEEAASHLPPLLVKAERVATIVAQGVHGRRRAGVGDAFWQYRRYQPGDPVQSIDWRQSAKAQAAYVRENEWEAAQNVYLWVDRSRSMSWHSHPDLPTKAARAAVLTLALASLLVRGGERIALLGGGRPATGRAVLSRLAVELSRETDGQPGLPSVEGLRRHGRLVLVGDMLHPVEEIEPVIRRFSADGHCGHVVQIRDPAEEALPFSGRTRFEGLEGEGAALLGRVESVRGEYADLVAANRRALADACRANGWSFSLNRTDQPVEPSLLALHMTLSEMERM